MSEKILLYGSPTCPMVSPVRGMFERASANYEYVDILRDSQARSRVREINRGYESVPTLVFPDGSTLTEPSLTELQTKLETLGYEVRAATLLDWLQISLENPAIRLFGIIFLVLGIINNTPILIVLGAVMMGGGFLLSWVRRKNR
jgi:mycoredoxin